MTHRILIRQDIYAQYQVVLQRKYWIWWGIAFYRRANLWDAQLVVRRLVNEFKCEVVRK